MKRIFSKTAFSLLELIIAAVLVVIVVMGIFSINSVLSNNNQDYGQRYLLKSATQTTLNHILNNASEAIGSGTYISPPNTSSFLDQGILIGNQATGGMGDQYSMCIHQDIVPPPYTSPTTIDNASINIPPSSPPSYTNSRWLCYTWNPSTYQINYCAMQYYYTSTNQGAASCNGIANSLFLGTASSNPFATSTTTLTTTSGFSITLNNCLNNSSPATCGTTSNPDVSLSNSVFPSQEGMQ